MDNQSIASKPWADTEVLIMPLTALGDLTIYLRLAWLFASQGAKVTLVSNILCFTQTIFPWLAIKQEPETVEFEALSSSYDLVIACFEKYFVDSAVQYSNIAFVTAKKVSRSMPLVSREVTIKGRTYPNATRSFCLNSKLGKTMVDWVDQYVGEVYGITATPQPLPQIEPPLTSNKRKVLIFPTTPHPKKNFWLKGFIGLAKRLQRNGWQVEFVCMPKEVASLEAQIHPFPLISCPTIAELVRYVSAASYVISNDSGGGHLASLCGIPSFTVTRREKTFTWRPGFSGRNTVISPLIKFKFLGEYVWRPFVPVIQVVREIGKVS